jgi:hypothetical protein
MVVLLATMDFQLSLSPGVITWYMVAEFAAALLCMVWRGGDAAGAAGQGTRHGRLEVHAACVECLAGMCAGPNPGPADTTA